MAVRWLIPALTIWWLSHDRVVVASPKHDELQDRSRMHTSEQWYGVSEDIRRLVTSGTPSIRENVGTVTCEQVHEQEFEPIRIGYEVLDVNGKKVEDVTDAKDLYMIAHVRDVLMARAVLYLHSTLSVRRASAPLRAYRIPHDCGKFPFETHETCASSSAPTCGPDDVPIPDN
jgi:hypothetical protein